VNPRTLLAGASLAGLLVALPATAATTYAGNGHLYEFVGQNLSWSAALAAAATWTPIAGYDSYLVTITDAGEDSFVKTLTGNASFVWAAGTDRDTEGTWTWAAGPEAGQAFYVLNAAIQPGYSHWNAGEPNNSNSENFLHFKANAGDWNDIYDTFGSGGFVVEYSLSANAGVPEPASWALMIGGFGLAGAALRRRRSMVAA